MQEKLKFPKYPPVFIIRITDRMRRIFIRLFRKFTHPNVVMIEMIQNLWLAGAIGAVTKLGIADILKEGQKSIDELAELTATQKDPLYRVMRALASNDIFKETGQRCFINTPLSLSLIEDQLKYFVMQHLYRLHFQMFSEMNFTLKTGKNASELFIDKNIFDHIGDDPELSQAFNKAMTNTTMMQTGVILPAYPFKKYKKIIDIGGGQGFLLAAILSKFKHLGGIVFDLPQAIKTTVQLFEKYGISDRAEVVEGSFFDTIPPGGDLYMLKTILHDWDDDICVNILKNIHGVLTNEGRLLIIESIIEEDNNPSFGKMFDLLMMIAIGGRERTKSEFETILLKAGFQITKIYRTIAPLSIIEAGKKST